MTISVANLKVIMEPIVTIQEGTLRGRVAEDWRGRQYYSFQGIPYGKPPVGELRFKAPEPAEPWTDIRDATKEASECFSRHLIFRTIIGSEDCLFLNVYTPELPQSNKNNLKAVMVWIHGGGFTTGSGNTDIYGPDYLVSEDVVIVTINYRLGALGFLSLEDSKLGVPGNAAFKDMILALKWVQRNIAKFNGDPNNVTIFGESAGGSAVHYLMLSSMATGLFHRVIAQSGCAINVWAEGTRCADQMAKHLGFDSSNEKEILKFLRDQPTRKILRAQEKIYDPFEASIIRPFGPIVEKPSDEPAFLTESPLDIITTGKFNKVPLMIGFTTREGMLFQIMSQRTGIPNTITDFETAIIYQLKREINDTVSKEIAQKIKTFYYGDEEPGENNVNKFYLLQTDNFFVRGILRTVHNQLETSASPIYLYRFAIESSLNVYKAVGNIKDPGVCHADDLGYLFKNMLTPKLQPYSIEDTAVKRFIKLWTTFAKFGNPNPTVKDSLINVTWKPANRKELNFLNIGENLTVGIDPENRRMEFWDEIYRIHPATSKL